VDDEVALVVVAALVAVDSLESNRTFEDEAERAKGTSYIFGHGWRSGHYIRLKSRVRIPPG
jgi:hypothetical protein